MKGAPVYCGWSACIRTPKEDEITSQCPWCCLDGVDIYQRHCNRGIARHQDGPYYVIHYGNLIVLEYSVRRNVINEYI